MRRNLKNIFKNQYMQILHILLRTKYKLMNSNQAPDKKSVNQIDTCLPVDIHQLIEQEGAFPNRNTVRSKLSLTYHQVRNNDRKLTTPTTPWLTCWQQEQNYLQYGLIYLYSSTTQPPRLWGLYPTRNLGGFFVPENQGLAL